MKKQNPITRKQVNSFQERVKESTGWLLLKDEIAIEYLAKTNEDLSFAEREEQAFKDFLEYYQSQKTPKETFQEEWNVVPSLHPYNKESWEKIAKDNDLELGEKKDKYTGLLTDLHPWEELERFKNLRKKKGIKKKPSLKLPHNKAARLVINIAAIVGWYALLRWVLIDLFYDLMRWINPEYNVFGVIPTVIDFLVIVIPIALVTKYIWFKKSRITTSMDD